LMQYRGTSTAARIPSELESMTRYCTQIMYQPAAGHSPQAMTLAGPWRPTDFWPGWQGARLPWGQSDSHIDVVSISTILTA